jgi:hypothetical protein
MYNSFVLQVSDVKNSFAMELQGLEDGLASLKHSGCTVGELGTDRHVSVKKYMREKQPDVRHYFDVWHMAKGNYRPSL